MNGGDCKRDTCLYGLPELHDRIGRDRAAERMKGLQHDTQKRARERERHLLIHFLGLRGVETSEREREHWECRYRKRVRFSPSKDSNENEEMIGAMGRDGATTILRRVIVYMRRLSLPVRMRASVVIFDDGPVHALRGAITRGGCAIAIETKR